MNDVLFKKNGKTIGWRKLTMEDANEVEKLMADHVKSEPLAAFLNSPDFEKGSLEKAKDVLAENISIGAYDYEDKDHLCAFCMVGLYDSTNLAPHFKEMCKKFPPMATIIPRLILKTILGIEEVLKGEKFLWHYFASTLPPCRNMGIGTELQRKAELIAKQQECRYVAGVYSSAYSKRTSEKLGYKCFKEILYIDYTDPLTGQKPFENVKFHTSIRSMYLDLKK